LEELELPLEFVSEAKENHGGMISIGLNYTAGLFPNPSNPLFISRGVQFTSPEREFRLEIDALFVRRDEAGFGGTIRVKAHVVKAPLFEDLENPPPSLYIHRGVTGEGKGATLVSSPEKDGEIVEGDTHARAGNLSKSKRKRPCISAAFRF
jgi:hypothetical protein